MNGSKDLSNDFGLWVIVICWYNSLQVNCVLNKVRRVEVLYHMQARDLRSDFYGDKSGYESQRQKDLRELGA